MAKRFLDFLFGMYCSLYFPFVSSPENIDKIQQPRFRFLEVKKDRLGKPKFMVYEFRSIRVDAPPGNRGQVLIFELI